MIQEAVFTALTSLVAGRVHPNVAPDSVVAPYIVYARVASAPETTLANGQPIQQTRLQVDVYDKTYAGVQTLAGQAITALTSAPVSAVQLLEQDQYEPDVKLHRVILDFSIWHY